MTRMFVSKNILKINATFSGEKQLLLAYMCTESATLTKNFLLRGFFVCCKELYLYRSNSEAYAQSILILSDC